MARILFISPLGTDAWNEPVRRVLAEAARSDTEFDVVSFPVRLNLPLKVSPYVGDTLLKVKKAEEEGYDGVIIGCAADPGVTEAKRMVKIPVVGLLEAQMHVGSMIGPRFSVVTINDRGTDYVYSCARTYGFEGYVASVKGGNITRIPDENKKCMEDPRGLMDATLALFKKAMQTEVSRIASEAVDRHSAKSLLFACGYYLGNKEERKAVTKEYGIPLLDPVATALKVVEAQIDALDSMDSTSRIVTPRLVTA